MVAGTQKAMASHRMSRLPDLVIQLLSAEHLDKLQSPRPYIGGAGFVSFIQLLGSPLLVR
jgi:hypothetical protein